MTEAIALRAGPSDLLAHEGALENSASWLLTLERPVKIVNGLQNEVITTKAKADKPPGPKVSTKGGLKVETEDGDFSFSVFGRLQADANFHDQDKSSLGDGTAIRRARLGVGGIVNKVWEYKFETDFGRNAANTVTITDAYVAFKGFKPATITVGHFKEPFSLEELTSSRFISFMERALPNVFAPARHIGIGADTVVNENIFLAAGIFGDGVDSDPAAEGDEGMDLVARAAYAPIMDKDKLVHVGVAGLFRDPSDTAVAFSARPETSITGVRWLNTGTIAEVDDIWQVDPEVALAWGPASFQAEYSWLDLSRQTTQDNVTLEGWYAFASYFLTGESRASMYKQGKFDTLKPNKDLGKDGGIGAVELLARVSDLDFDDRAFQSGHERNYTAGITWYVNQYFKFMANYIWIDNNHSAIGSGASAPGALNPLIGVRDDDPEVAMIRAAVYW